jgi:hypothetical protein
MPPKRSAAAPHTATLWGSAAQISTKVQGGQSITQELGWLFTPGLRASANGILDCVSWGAGLTRELSLLCCTDYVRRYAQPESLDPRNLEKAANESDGDGDEEMKDGEEHGDTDSDDGFLSSSDEEEL